MTDRATPPSPHSEWVELILGCTSWQEAQRVVDHLLEQKLIASAEFFKTDGVQLILQTAASELTLLEETLKRLGSYQPTVLNLHA